jgi:hypothetical protein
MKTPSLVSHQMASLWFEAVMGLTRRTVTDSIGNQNNMIPAQGIPPVDASAKTSHVLPPLDTDNRSSTPIEEIARVAAEVADTAAAIGRVR